MSPLRSAKTSRRASQDIPKKPKKVSHRNELTPIELATMNHVEEILMKDTKFVAQVENDPPADKPQAGRARNSFIWWRSFYAVSRKILYPPPGERVISQEAGRTWSIIRKESDVSDTFQWFQSRADAEKKDHDAKHSSGTVSRKYNKKKGKKTQREVSVPPTSLPFSLSNSPTLSAISTVPSISSLSPVSNPPPPSSLAPVCFTNPFLVKYQSMFAVPPIPASLMYPPPPPSISPKTIQSFDEFTSFDYMVFASDFDSSLPENTRRVGFNNQVDIDSILLAPTSTEDNPLGIQHFNHDFDDPFKW